MTKLDGYGQPIKCVALLPASCSEKRLLHLHHWTASQHNAHHLNTSISAASSSRKQSVLLTNQDSRSADNSLCYYLLCRPASHPVAKATFLHPQSHAHGKSNTTKPLWETCQTVSATWLILCGAEEFREFASNDTRSKKSIDHAFLCPCSKFEWLCTTDQFMEQGQLYMSKTTVYRPC